MDVAVCSHPPAKDDKATPGMRRGPLVWPLMGGARDRTQRADNAVVQCWVGAPAVIPLECYRSFSLCKPVR